MSTKQRMMAGVLAVLALAVGGRIEAQQLERVSQRLENPWGMSFVDADTLLVT